MTARPTAAEVVRQGVIDALVMSPLADTAGTSLVPFERAADAVLAVVEAEMRRLREETAIRPAMSTWLTLALDIAQDGVSDDDLHRLRDWIDSGCVGEMPTPRRGSEAETAARALDEAADRWQRGEWADAPRCTSRVQERIANGQHVTDWLRARAAALRAGETGGA